MKWSVWNHLARFKKSDVGSQKCFGRPFLKELNSEMVGLKPGGQIQEIWCWQPEMLLEAFLKGVE